MTEETKNETPIAPSQPFPAVAPSQEIPDLSQMLPKSERPAQSKSENCGNCLFSRSILAGQQIAMECHCEPPRVFMVPGGRGGIGWAGAFPPTKNELWCGHWSPKKA